MWAEEAEAEAGPSTSRPSIEEEEEEESKERRSFKKKKELEKKKLPFFLLPCPARLSV